MNRLLSTPPKKLFASVLTAAAAIVLVAGCGSGGSGSSNSGGNQASGQAGAQASGSSGGRSGSSGGTGNSSGGSSSGGGLSGKMVVGTWGGDYEQFQKDSVIPALHQDDPNLNVVFETNNAPPREAKMEAEKSGTSTFDVVHFSDADAQKMIDQGLLMQLDYSKIPNAANVVKNLSNQYWIPHIYSADGIVYNTQKITTPPDSFSIFWDAKYAGKIGVLSTDWDSWVYAAAAYTDKGNPGTNWDVGWPALKQLAGKVQIFPSQEQLAAALQSGQVWLTYDWKARYYQWKTAGMPIGYALPKETTYPVIFTAGIPKNAPDVAAGYAYLNAMLAPSAQAYFANKMGYSPTVTNSGISSDLQSAIGFSAEDNKLIIPWNDDYVAKNDSAWQKEWEQYITSK
jgi:putative spermidine/putrescine transport system substrate-binding protein